MLESIGSFPIVVAGLRAVSRKTGDPPQVVVPRRGDLIAGRARYRLQKNISRPLVLSVYLRVPRLERWIRVVLRNQFFGFPQQSPLRTVGPARPVQLEPTHGHRSDFRRQCRTLPCPAQRRVGGDDIALTTSVIIRPEKIDLQLCSR